MRYGVAGCALFIVLITVHSPFCFGAADLFPHKAVITHAVHFSIEYHDTYKVVTVLSPWEKSDDRFRYVLVPRGVDPPPGVKSSRVVEVPVRSIVTMSLTYLPYLDMLGELDALVGHDACRYIYNPAIRKRVEDGKVRSVGSGPSLNMEILMDLAPELVMTYGVGRSADTHHKMEEAGLTVVVNGEHMERTPLGRTEWIKFIAAFFNREAEAERIFSGIAASYGEMAEKARAVAAKPTVFTNAPWQGTWWLPGGDSFAAVFLEDAGADYLWSDDDSSGSIPFDFEAVYERAAEADFWLNTQQWTSLGDALREDERFAAFKAFRDGNVYNNNARMNAAGGNDYNESAIANPHIVLADLIRIFHPALAPDHELVYYRRLE